MTTPIVLGVVPARGGSKGVPAKNLRPVEGRPLVARAVDCALRCALIDRLIVSTDSPEIAAVARDAGALVPFMRPPELAQDSTPMLPVLQHAVQQSESAFGQTVRCVVLVDPTAPLRTPGDIEKAFELFADSGCDAVVSGHEAHRNPYFNMVAPKGDYVALASETSQAIGRRQDAPVVYDLNTVVWIYSRKALMEEKARIPRKTKLYLVPRERAVDLDTESDFQLLEFLLEKKEFREN